MANFIHPPDSRALVRRFVVRDSSGEGVVRHLADELVLVELPDAGGADRIRAVDQAVPPFRLQQRALVGREGFFLAAILRAGFLA